MTTVRKLGEIKKSIEFQILDVEKDHKYNQWFMGLTSDPAIRQKYHQKEIKFEYFYSWEVNNEENAIILAKHFLKLGFNRIEADYDHRLKEASIGEAKFIYILKH